jgi:hypothetical protein
MAEEPNTDKDPRFPGTGNYLDWLMSMDPLELSAQNIDQVIAYHRRNRSLVDAGVKPKKNEGPKVDLAKIGLGKAPQVVKRRVIP